MKFIVLTPTKMSGSIYLRVDRIEGFSVADDSDNTVIWTINTGEGEFWYVKESPQLIIEKIRMAGG
jgi:hypothetical protein